VFSMPCVYRSEPNPGVMGVGLVKDMSRIFRGGIAENLRLA
jgi:hypothetical protein